MSLRDMFVICVVVCIIDLRCRFTAATTKNTDLLGRQFKGCGKYESFVERR